MILLFLASICSVLLLLLIWKIHWTANYWKNAGIPYEPYTSYLHFFLFRQGTEDIFRMLGDYGKKYGPVYGTYQGLKPVLRVSSRDGIKDALSRNFHSTHGRAIFAPIGSKLWDNNILALNYREWKLVRPLSSHVLTGFKLKSMQGKIEHTAKRLTEKLEKIAGSNGVIPTSEYARGVIMDGVAAVTFSLEVDAIEDPNNVFVEHCTGVFNKGLGVVLLNSFPQLIRYLPSVQVPVVETERFFVQFAETMMRKRRQPGWKNSTSDALDSWMEAQKTNPELTDDLLISQIFVFFVAGFESASYTLTFALYLLATHPKKQEAIYRNIMENISDPNNISFEEYGKMKLLEAAIFETLRLYPTDYVIDRFTIEPCTVAGVPLERGIGIQIPQTCVHRDPERFSDPLHFKPERFIEGGESTQEVMAFGDGPKNCVGQRLAITQLVIVLAAILRAVRLEPADDAYDPSLEYQPELERSADLFVPAAKRTLKVKLAPRN